jgi:23S rRNA (guanosine2251-2'-O)-methyltransferase
MSGKINEVWIGSEHEIEEAFASPRVTVQQCYAVQRADGYLKSMLQQYGIKQQIRMMDEKSMSSMSRQKGNKYWVQVTLSVDETIEDYMEDAPKPEMVLILDQIQDPQNLGALIRSAHFFGVNVVLMPKDHTAPITDVVSRASAGAVFSVPIIRATNLVREINKLKELGLYMISLSPESREPLHTKDFKRDAVGLVIGSEGSGVRRLVEQTCDFQCSLTSKKGRDSLNASVAGGIALFEISRQKNAV